METHKVSCGIVFLILSLACFGADGLPEADGSNIAPPPISVNTPPKPTPPPQVIPTNGPAATAPSAPNAQNQINSTGGTVTVEATDSWQKIFTQIIAALFGLGAAITGAAKILQGILNSHHAANEETTDWKDLLAFCFANASGSGLQRVENAALMVPAQYLARYGVQLPIEDRVAARHGLTALLLELSGPPVIPATVEDTEMQKLKDQMAALEAKKAKSLNPTGAALVILILAPILALGFTSCTKSDKAKKVADDIALSNAASVSAYNNALNIFVNYYVNEQYAQIDADTDASIKSLDPVFQSKIDVITVPIKLADGTTTMNADPSKLAAILTSKANDIKILQKQNAINKLQVDSVAANMRVKIKAMGTDAQHVAALTAGLQAYFTTKTNTNAAINQSADSVLGLIQQFMPQSAPAAVPVIVTNPTAKASLIIK